jgi:hypothetical protein
MKKYGLLAVVFVTVLIMASGCATSIKDVYGGTAWNISVPAAKDVKILGIVRVEGLVTQGSGEKVTYDSLLKAAEAKGGDGIVNVFIDVKKDVIKIFFWQITTAETWYGSALAIKYTDDNLSTVIVDSEGNTIKESVEKSEDKGPLSQNSLLLNILGKTNP